MVTHASQTTRPPRVVPDRLAALESRTIEIFVSVARALRMPQSVGEIYGLLYVALEPVSFDFITRKLAMSQGSASQGLKFLREIGAVRRIYMPQSRRNHYVAETDLGALASIILRERFTPRFTVGDHVLIDLLDIVADMPGAEGHSLHERVEQLREWNSQARKLIPLMIHRLAGGPNPEIAS